MNIVWYGQSFFRVSAQKDRNSNIELAIEPFSKEGDIKAPKIKADVVIEKEGKSQSDLSNIEGDYFSISDPGEYEIGGVFIQKVSYSRDKSFYLIEAEGIKICHLGSFDRKEVEGEYLDMISKTDILMIPVGGSVTINSKEAAKLSSQIEPKIVIPMNYRISGLKEKMESAEEFLKVMGVGSKEKIPKLSVKERDFPSKEGMEVVVLSAKS